MDAVGLDLVSRRSKPELAVFVSGVASMGLEMLAFRMIAPHFGTHIYTTGAIITVFLAALSYGYWQGGKRASWDASTDRLFWLLVLTAVYVALVLFVRDLLIPSTSTIPLNSRYASIPAIVLLFGPPTYLLGFISPYAAELSQRGSVGEASGRIYAVGTIGSILGSGATTFVLIPTMSIDGIGLFFGLLLVATALVLTLPTPEPRPVLATLLVTLLLVGSVSGSAAIDVRGDVVYRTQTQYQQLEVIDSGDTRTLYLDGARHSAMDLGDPDRHVFEYSRYFHLPFLHRDDVDRVLFVGGGGFSGPKAFVGGYDDVTVDVVELDPEVIEVAREYFAVNESERLRIHQGDGRQFLDEAEDGTYDVIVLDAYKQDKVPFHLTTVEFMELVASKMDDDGVLVSNVISAPSGPASAFYRAEYRTMEEAFPQVYAYRTSEITAVQNIEMVATKDSERLSKAQLHARNEERDVGIDLGPEIDSEIEDVDTSEAPVLRDDGPTNNLLDPMLGQRYVIEESDPTREDDDRSRDPATVDGIASSPSITAPVAVRGPPSPIHGAVG